MEAFPPKLLKVEKQETMTNYPEPPAHFSERSKTIWRTIGPTHVRSLGRQMYFQSALESLDRAEEARKLIEIEGLTSKTTSTGALHVHPLAKVEKEHRQLFCKLWDTLKLRFDPQVDGAL